MNLTCSIACLKDLGTTFFEFAAANRFELILSAGRAGLPSFI
jgi:hypothetical protein